MLHSWFKLFHENHEALWGAVSARLLYRQQEFVLEFLLGSARITIRTKFERISILSHCNSLVRLECNQTGLSRYVYGGSMVLQRNNTISSDLRPHRLKIGLTLLLCGVISQLSSAMQQARAIQIFVSLSPSRGIGPP